MSKLNLKNIILAVSLALNMTAGSANAQSEASIALSALPVASVMGVAGSVAGAAVAARPRVGGEPVGVQRRRGSPGGGRAWRCARGGGAPAPRLQRRLLYA